MKCIVDMHNVVHNINNHLLRGDAQGLVVFRRQIAYPCAKYKKSKIVFCVLVCCTGSAVYLAGRHVKKSNLIKGAPKRIFLTCNYYTVFARSARKDIWCFMLKISGSNFLQLFGAKVFERCS